MTHRMMMSLALAAALLGATSAMGAGMKLDSAVGDWSCALGGQAAGTLSVRPQSYVLSRSGTAMAGEYQQDGEHMLVSSGPLRGIGVESGTLAAGAGGRILAFPTAGGTVLSCSEVL